MTTDDQRSAIMRAVKSQNTKPEVEIRSFLHRNGYRFRLHRKDLPGTPDLVFPRLKKVIFVNGCFWHGHDCKRGARLPKSNSEYWPTKIDRNRSRDNINVNALRELGWHVLVVWECELSSKHTVAETLRNFLG